MKKSLLGTSLLSLFFILQSQLLNAQRVIHSQIAAFEITATINDVSCFGLADGSIVISNVSGGTPPYSYIWSTGSTSNQILNLAIGTYSCTITDSGGPQQSAIFTGVVNQPSQLIASITPNFQTCITGGPNFIVSLTANGSGGNVGNYKYTWNNGDTTQTINKLSGSTYQVTVCDSKNCKATANYTPTGPFDVTPPNLAIPDNLTINCNQINPLPDLGTAIFSDPEGCPVTLTIDTIYNLNMCQTGNISRKFTATDISGNSTVATQVITVNYVANFTVVFPKDTTVFNCIDTTVLQPRNLIQPFKEPIISNIGCSNIYVGYFDLVLGSPKACYKILRKWKVFDMCVNPLGNPNLSGYYEGEQHLIVMDSIPPVLKCPANVTVNTATSSKNVVLPDATATDCSTLLTFTNSHNSGGKNASGIYYLGLTNVVFTVSDDCKNISTCQMSVLVRDSVRPVAVCHTASTINLTEMQNGIMAMVPAFIYNNNSYDNLTSRTNLTFKIRRLGDPNPPTDSITYNCDDRCSNQGTGVVEMELWVYDEYGNYDNCVFAIQVQDNNKLCQPCTVPQFVSVAGTIKTNEGKTISGVQVKTNDNSLKNRITEKFGIFQFNEVPFGSNISIIPEKNDDTPNGISTLDLVLIRKHIMGTEEFVNPYKQIAADINKSGNISTADMVELRKIILQIQNQLSNNKSWRFVSKNYQFKTNEPLKESFPEIQDYKNVVEDMKTLDFVGVKIGDLDGNAATTNLTEGEERKEREDFLIEIKDEQLLPNQTYKIPIFSKEVKNMIGFQQTLKWDLEKIRLKGIKNGILPNFDESNQNLTNIENGFLTHLWENAAPVSIENNFPIMIMEIEVIEECNLSEVLSTTSEKIISEAYFQNGDNYEVKDMKIVWQDRQKNIQVEDVLDLYQNKPNPFNNSTRIGFNLNKDETIKLKIFDSTGKVVSDYCQKAVKGYNEIEVNLEHLPYSSLYYYQLNTTQKILTKKMLRIK